MPVENVTTGNQAPEQAAHSPIGLAEWVERQHWLDRPAEALQKGVHGAYRAAGSAGQAAKNFAHGTWLGHPLHPVLTDFAIGAWTAMAVLDGAEAMAGRRRYAPGADLCLAAGLAGAVTAAVSGLTDWSDIDDKARRVGLAHGIMNIAVASLMTASLFERRAGRRGSGVALSSIGFAMMFGGAYLGGNLVYGKQIGVSHTAGEKLPEQWTRVLAETELREGEPRRVEAGGVKFVLVRSGGRIQALAEVCSHLGGPLAEGALEGDSIRCPWHGSRFSLDDGRVLDGPATHPQPCCDVRVREGQIELRGRTTGE